MTTRMKLSCEVVATGSHDWCAAITASRFNEATELGYLLAQSVGLVPGDDHQLMILDCVRRRRYALWLRRRARRGLTQQWTSSNGVPVTCIMHRIPNDFSIVDSLSLGGSNLSLIPI